MISLIPVFLLVAASIILQVLGRTRFSPGRTWLLASIVAVMTWIAMILIRLLMPTGWEIHNWLSGVTTSETIVFQYSEESWILGFLLVSLFVAVIFYEARYLDSGSHVNILTGTMMLTAVGLLSIQSGNGLTFLLTWVLIDIAEFLILVGIIKETAKHRISIISLLARFFGIILMMSYLILRTPGSVLDVEKGNLSTGVLIIFIALLRMGIIPLHIPYSEEPKIRRGIGSILRFLPILSVFSFLIFCGPQLFTKIQYGSTLTIVTTGVLFGALSWFFSRSELGGRPYWVFSFGCLALIAFLRGSMDALVGISIMMVVGGSVLFLFLPRKQKAGVLLPLILPVMFAIPFTPTAAIPLAIWGDRAEVANFFLLLSLTLLIGGVIRHSSRIEGKQKKLEDWVWLFQITGLIIVAIAPWIAEIFSLEKLRSLKYWWFPVSLAVIIGLAIFLDFLQRRSANNLINRIKEYFKRMEPVILNIDKLFRFNWIVRLFEATGTFIGSAIGFLVRILEGDGGILWSFLLLILLASLLIAAQVQ